MALEVDETASLELFFEMSLDHLVIAGFDGYFKRLSRAWMTTFGWTLDEFMSRPNIEFVHPDDREKTLSARRGLIDGVPLTGLLNRYLCKDGTFRWMSWKSIGLARFERVYAVARDVTREIEAERTREQTRSQMMFAERMASVGRLAQGVAHEINNPLSYVIANLKLLRDAAPQLSLDDPELRPAELISDALDGAERIKAIVRALKTVSSTDGPGGPVELPFLLEQTLTLLHNEIKHHTRITREFRPVPPVHADAGQLLQVFLGLLTNAVQAARAGAGEHHIAVHTWQSPEGDAVVEIRDSGVGIPRAHLPRVFDPFFTTRPPGQGTGLGLWSCHSIVVALGGQLSVESTEGVGTEVRVMLPGAPADPGAS